LQHLQATAHFGFVPKRIQQLSDPNLVVHVVVGQDPQRRPLFLPVEADQAGILTSLLTTMFLHAGWWHLLGNMWFLWIFGNNVEDRLGHVLFLLFYLLGGLIATGCHWAFEPYSEFRVIGASGAVAAVLGAYAVTFPHARVRCLIFIVIFITLIDVPAILVLGVWIVGQILSALNALGRVNLTGGVAWWAHVGGFAAGALLMPTLASLVKPSDETPGQEEWWKT